MQDRVTVWEYEGKKLRMIMMESEPWFLAQDVCDILAVRYDQETLGILDRSDVGRVEMLDVVNEAGLLDLIFLGHQWMAKRFRRWFIHEVLPSILGQSRPGVGAEVLSSHLELLLRLERRQQEMENRTAEAERRITAVKNTIIRREDNWRDGINAMVNSIVRSTKEKNYQDIRRRSYRFLEERARCKLAIRLVNMRRRLMERGAARKVLDTLTIMDVIEEDPRLKEVYSAIVREMKVQYVV